MTAPARAPRRAVHGVLLLDKPVGLSSNGALQRVKRLLRAEKAGHTGTLDPLAGGLLPVCLGAATKFSQASLDAAKGYRATLMLGARSTTFDGEGTLHDERPIEAGLRDVEACLPRFLGEQTQRPPMHSALKKDGRALYEYAREGIEVDRAPRRVVIHSLAIVDWCPPLLRLDVLCSKGTYIRSLADDFGAALGCGAWLSALQRTRSGPLRLEDAVTLDALEAMDEAARDALLRPIDVLLADWPRVTLDAPEAARFLTGLRRRVDLPDAAPVRVYGPGAGGAPGAALLGSAHVSAGELIPDRLLSPLEVQAQVA